MRCRLARPVRPPRLLLSTIALLLLHPRAGAGAATETLLLDTRGPAVTTAAALEAATWYRITVTGTYSAWTAPTWGIPCGVPESAPQLPSGGVTNGPVGLDAEVWFAAAMCGATDPNCCCNTPCPHHYAYFWMNLDGNWSHVEPIDGAHETPTAGHVYEYHVEGQGFPVSFLNYDDVYVDNYGVLAITVEPLTTGAERSRPRANTLILGAPSPNPSSGPTRLAFWLQAEAAVNLGVYDVAGRRVHEVAWAKLPPGGHSFLWNGSTANGAPAPAGIYFVRLRALGTSRTQRVAIVR